MVAKLYVLVRSDLSMGARVAQAIHGARQFAAEHPIIELDWFQTSNTVAVLDVRDEAHLLDLTERADVFGIPHATFREPDMGDSTTVRVLGQHPNTRRITSSLPLLS